MSGLPGPAAGRPGPIVELDLAERRTLALESLARDIATMAAHHRPPVAAEPVGYTVAWTAPGSGRWHVTGGYPVALDDARRAAARLAEDDPSAQYAVLALTPVPPMTLAEHTAHALGRIS